MNVQKIFYWIATLLLAVLLFTSVYGYVIHNEAKQQDFVSMNYPGYLVNFLAAAKSLGIIAILANIKQLREWAYAGLFYIFVLAFVTHIQLGDNEYGGAVAAMALLFVSYFLGKKVRK